MNKLTTSLTAIATLGLASSSFAAITLVSSDATSNGNGNQYGTDFFTGVAVQAGDVLVLTHSTNKRDNGNNTISASTSTSETFTPISAGDSSGGSAAWIFYTTITTAGSIDISFATNAGDGNGSKSNGYYLLRAGSGEVIQLSDSQTAVTDGVATSLGITFDSGATGDFSVLALALDANADNVTTPTDFTEEINGNQRRVLYSDASLSNLNPTFDVAITEFGALAGASFTAVPEPSSTMLLGLGGIAFILRRRK